MASSAPPMIPSLSAQRRLQHRRSWMTTLSNKQGAPLPVAPVEHSDSQGRAVQAQATVELEVVPVAAQELPSLYPARTQHPLALPSPTFRPHHSSLPALASYSTASRRISTEQATAHWDVELAKAEQSWNRRSMRDGARDPERRVSGRRALNRSFSAPVPSKEVATDPTLPNLSLVWENLLEEADITIDEGQDDEGVAVEILDTAPALPPFLPSPTLLAKRRARYIRPLALISSSLVSSPSTLASTFSPHSPSPPPSSFSSPASIESVRFYGLAITDGDIEYDSSLLNSSLDESSDTSASSIGTESPRLPLSTAFSEGEFSPFPAYPGDGCKVGWTPIMGGTERGWGLEWGTKSMYRPVEIGMDSEDGEEGGSESSESEYGSEGEGAELTAKYYSEWSQGVEDFLSTYEEGTVEYGVAY